MPPLTPIENVCSPPDKAIAQLLDVFIPGAEDVNGADFILDVDVEFVVLLDDERVFKAMAISGTPCPILNADGVSVIGKKASEVLIKEYNYEMPTYKKWVELNKNKKKPFKKSTQIHK